jgi:ParB-like chromosome segregation protein Spo0J
MSSDQPGTERGMNVRTLPIDNNQPSESGVRHTDDLMDNVTMSMRAFGCRQPIVVDDDGRFALGWCRMRAGASCDQPRPERSLNLPVTMRPISNIRPFENNARHNDEVENTVRAPTRAFGFRQPIVVDDGIVVGHARYIGGHQSGQHRSAGPSRRRRFALGSCRMRA